MTGTAEERSEEVAWALAYPFIIPPGSYVFTESGENPVKRDEISDLIFGRTPVIAAGSNASPSQLIKKRERFGLAGEIPVIKARLSGFDVVYSAHIVSYGSIPAMLEPSKGTEVNLFVTFLNEDQLYPMDESEDAIRKNGNYKRDRLKDIRLVLESDEVLEEALSYQSRRGGLVLDGQYVALTAITAESRRFPAMSQIEVQERVRDLLAPGAPLDEFILGNIDDENLRAERNRRMKSLAEADS